MRRLLLDALAVERLLPEVESIVDLGAGAGIPGIPLALARRRARVSLIEARERRHHFQRAAIRTLDLSARVTPIRGRIEELDAQPAGLVIAQAVGTPDAVAELAWPWVRPGGWLAIPGGPTMAPLTPPPALEAARLETYPVPLGGPTRRLWLARRI